jgi:hypothetical protein
LNECGHGVPLLLDESVAIADPALEFRNAGVPFRLVEVEAEISEDSAALIFSCVAVVSNPTAHFANLLDALLVNLPSDRGHGLAIFTDARDKAVVQDDPVSSREHDEYTESGAATEHENRKRQAES